MYVVGQNVSKRVDLRAYRSKFANKNILKDNEAIYING